MLRNKSSSGMMSSPKNPTTSISSILGSPRFLNGILTKHFSEAESAIMSPTSILDTKNSSISANPFGHDKNLLSKSPIPSPKLDSEAIGLALIDSIKDDDSDEDKDGINFSKPISRMVLFGSKLKVQIPTTLLPSSSISPVESPKSPADFGIKTRDRDSQMMSPFSCKEKENPHSFTRQLSLKEMEMSEDYTCVITHGPNPKTTHIYDNCIVESCCGDLNLSEIKKRRDCDFEDNFSVSSPSVDFLSCCHSCKTILGDGKDVYMYRGDKALCSHECRCQEMLFEGIKNPEMDNSF